MPAAVEAFCAARGIDPGYLLYAGRREAAKGLPELFAHYAALRRAVPDAPPLALMGAGDLPAAGRDRAPRDRAGLRAAGRARRRLRRARACW